jgi:hypothetical protein
MRKVIYRVSSWLTIEKLGLLAVVLMMVVYLFLPFLKVPVVHDVLARPLLLNEGGGTYAGEGIYESVTSGLTDDSGNLRDGTLGVIGVVDSVLGVLRNILGPILVVFFVYIAVRMIIAQGEEEEINKMGKWILYILMGIAFIVLAEVIRDIFTVVGKTGVQQQSFLSDGRVEDAGNAVSAIFEGVVTFMRYLLGGIALFYTVKSGALIIFASGQEEEVTKQKEVFMWGFVGFIVIMVGDALIHYVVFPSGSPGAGGVAGGQLPSVSAGIGLLVKLTNLLLSIIGGVAVLTLVAGGVMYSVSAGDEQKSGQATKIIYGSLMGLIIAFSSYTIVSEFVPQQREVSTVAPPSGISPLGGGLPSAPDSPSVLPPGGGAAPAGGNPPSGS